MGFRGRPIILFIFSALARPCPAEASQAWQDFGLWAPVAARGFAATAVAGRPETVFFNPAGLTQVKNPQLVYSHGPWSPSLDDDAIAYAQNLGGTALGFGLHAFRWGGASKDDGVLSAARRFDNLALGGGVRGTMDPSGPEGRLWAGDLGLLWSPKGLAVPLSLGAALLGLPAGSPQTPNAQRTAVGAALNYKGVDMSLDAQQRLGAWALRAGVESRVHGLLTLRGGLGPDGAGGLGFSGGLGVRYGPDLRLDYAAFPAGATTLHSVSLGISFSQGAKAFVDAGHRKRRPRSTPIERGDEGPAEAEAEAAAAGFTLSAKVKGRVVSLDWTRPEGAVKKELRYIVTLGMLPNAKFRPLHDPPLYEPGWNGEMALRGVNYYFRVETLLPNGEAGPSSNTLPLLIP